ncbi:MAG: DUF1501 domain-containing protein [Actinomycetota bacterium]
MLSRDHTADEARRLLAAPSPDLSAGVGSLSRRRFLQAVGMGVAGGALAGTMADGVLSSAHEAFASQPVAPTDGILVTIMLYGGNDGLNTVVPYSDGNYYSQRGAVAIAPSDVLRINNSVGLHPNLGFVKSLYDTGQVAVVQGVGYPNPDLSHFASMGTWMNSSFVGGATPTGWIGRWLDGLPVGTADMAAATIDTSVALHLLGRQRRGFAVSPVGNSFGQLRDPQDLRMYDGFRTMASAASGHGALHDMFAATMQRQLTVADQVAPVFNNALPDHAFPRKMTMAARLINADLGLRVVDIPFDSFDSHGKELGDHGVLLADLDAGIRAFMTELDPRFRDQVTLMTMSEFGRTSYSNGSAGTDHGTASSMFVIGSRVRGGLYGSQPILAGLSRWDRMVHTLDFRAVIGSVVDGWLGGGGSTIVEGNFEALNLFTAAPAGVPSDQPSVPAVVLPDSQASGFEALNPVRVIDTRDGTGGRSIPLRAQESWAFPLAGHYGIPANAVAVALNVTTVNATQDTFVTVYPHGEARPVASNLNPAPGAVTPNLVIARVGLAGAIEIYNNTGTVNVIADVVGYFTPDSDCGLCTIDPARLVDTRDGTGGFTSPIEAGQWIDVQVTGIAGVPDNAQSVALNITATQPTAASYLTVWPTGDTMPLASSVNMAPGQTIPNMVLARVGTGGKVSIFNAAGSTHVVVDVFGAFCEGATSRFVPVSPQRALDTRSGVGAPQGRVSRGEVPVTLAGRSGVPATGCSAVLMNVTAVLASQGTFVTVFPSGRSRPASSNLNVVSGQVVPNMVLARLGDDGSSVLYNNSGTIDLVADVMGYFTL